MITREEALKFGLSFDNVYEERPFRDQNWQVVRERENKKIFLWIYERNGYVNLNVKADPEWRDFWRSAYESVQAGYHQNKEHWNTIIVDEKVNNNLVKEIEKSQLKTDIPSFSSGDTVNVYVRIIENGKERLQLFQGVVMARVGGGVGETFIVRKISNGIGVERTFPLHSPSISKIEVVKKGKVRRNKIFYLRERSGKAARIKTVL